MRLQVIIALPFFDLVLQITLASPSRPLRSFSQIAPYRCLKLVYGVTKPYFTNDIKIHQEHKPIDPRAYATWSGGYCPNFHPRCCQQPCPNTQKKINNQVSRFFYRPSERVMVVFVDSPQPPRNSNADCFHFASETRDMVLKRKLSVFSKEIIFEWEHFWMTVVDRDSAMETKWQSQAVLHVYRGPKEREEY